MNQSRILGRQTNAKNFTDTFGLPENLSHLKATDQNIELLTRRIKELEHRLLIERIRNEQLLSLNEFSHQLENLLDQPVEAQLAANTLHAVFKCNLVLVLFHNPAEQRLQLMAAAGPDAQGLSANFRHSLTRGLVGRAIRARRPLITQDSNDPNQVVEMAHLQYRAQMVVPLMYHSNLEGAIILCDSEPDAFDPEDLPYVEALANRLMIAWENDRNWHNLTELVKSAASLSTTLNPAQLLDRIAEIACNSTGASFALVGIRHEDHREWQTGSSGKTPLPFHSTRAEWNSLLQTIFNSKTSLRIRDLHKDPRTAHLTSAAGDCRSMLATPILIDGEPTGVILLFGKQTAPAFSEQDEFLLNLLSTHAAVSVERCLLDEQLRTTLKTTQLLYDLSIRIAETDNLHSAAQVIGRTAFRLFQASTCGLVLFSEEGLVEASVVFPGDDPQIQHPEELIRQTMETRQIAFQPLSDDQSRIAIPIQTPRRCYGALWLEMDPNLQTSHQPVDEIRILINQAAVALERSILLAETRQQASKIAQAYTELEQSYDQTLLALMNSLEARDHETERHTLRVSQIALAIGERLGLSASELKALQRGALLHDIGKIGISDSILLKKGKLDPAEWNLMRKHPDIGAEIIRDIPFLSEAIPVVANHHERWNGSGYPKGLRGEEIPLLARIFIVADVFDALTSDRIYREKVTYQAALEYINSQSGILFDPHIVGVLNRVIQDLPEAILE